MIKKEIIEALKIISRKLKDRKIKWVLVGSTSLALQEVKIKPKDIDILTDREGAFKINGLLKKYEVKPVKFKRSKFFESYLGKFKIGGVKVEVMGNLKEKVSDKWISLSRRLRYPKIIKFKGMKLPVSSLEEQLESYSKLGRKKDHTRVQKIKEALKSESITKLTKTA